MVNLCCSEFLEVVLVFFYGIFIIYGMGMLQILYNPDYGH